MAVNFGEMWLKSVESGVKTQIAINKDIRDEMANTRNEDSFAYNMARTNEADRLASEDRARTDTTRNAMLQKLGVATPSAGSTGTQNTWVGNSNSGGSSGQDIAYDDNTNNYKVANTYNAGVTSVAGASKATTTLKDISPAQRAFLDTIGTGEGIGVYNNRNGGKDPYTGKWRQAVYYDDLSKHPQVPVEGGRGTYASGKYGFLGSTWNRASAKTGVKDFSPQSQDINALWLARDDYKRKTNGRDFDTDLENGVLNWKALNTTWTSIPGGVEADGVSHSRKSEEFMRNFNANLERAKLIDAKFKSEGSATAPQDGRVNPWSPDFKHTGAAQMPTKNTRATPGQRADVQGDTLVGGSGDDNGDDLVDDTSTLSYNDGVKKGYTMGVQRYAFEDNLIPKEPDPLDTTIPADSGY